MQVYSGCPMSNVSFRGKCARMENTLKIPSPTKLARLGHSPPVSPAGRLAGPVFYVLYMSFLCDVLYCTVDSILVLFNFLQATQSLGHSSDGKVEEWLTLVKETLSLLLSLMKPVSLPSANRGRKRNSFCSLSLYSLCVEEVICLFCKQGERGAKNTTAI